MTATTFETDARLRRAARRIVALAGVGLVLVGTGAAVALRAGQPSALDCGVCMLVAEPPIRTGHQRAERVGFADDGRLLAVTCPRYNHVVLYAIEPDGAPEEIADIATGGRPVAIQAARDRLYVLLRPSGDARHVEPAWWQAFDFAGNPLGSKFRVGWDPDDMVLTDDGKTMLVLLSGHAEGESNRPAPSLLVVDLTDPEYPQPRGQLTFDEPGDDPERLALQVPPGRNADGKPGRAAVSLRGTNAIAWVALDDLGRPRLVARTPLPGAGVPGALRFRPDGRLLIADDRGEALWSCGFGDAEATRSPFAAGGIGLMPGDLMIVTNPAGSALDVLDAPMSRRLGSLPLRGGLGLGTVLPTGLAVGPGQIAVADRSGGVHLVRVHWKDPGRR